MVGPIVSSLVLGLIALSARQRSGADGTGDTARLAQVCRARAGRRGTRQNRQCRAAALAKACESHDPEVRLTCLDRGGGELKPSRFSSDCASRSTFMTAR